MSTPVYLVEGMTCGHCAASVTKAVRGVTGVQDVQVDVAAGTMTVHTGTAEQPDEAQVAAAVADAGYAVVGRA